MYHDSKKGRVYPCSPVRTKDGYSCDSRLEHRLLQQLQAGVAGKRCELRTQFEVVTRAGRFWLDFMIERNARRVGIEADGESHRGRLGKDRHRDAVILESNHVDRIIRFPYYVINANSYVVPLLRAIESDFFPTGSTDPAYVKHDISWRQDGEFIHNANFSPDSSPFPDSTLAVVHDDSSIQSTVSAVKAASSVQLQQLLGRRLRFDPDDYDNLF